ncbi:MAG TPA: phosphatase domain-containing protein, partial [bacterium]|nr:phosphatase domain-containing protein [bacterium]
PTAKNAGTVSTRDRAKPKPPKTAKPKERRERQDRPKRGEWVDLVVPPDPFVCPVPADAKTDVYVWDLDRTYLRTEFESIRDLIRTALQKAKDKVAYPGVSALIRALRAGPDEGGAPRPIYFISASPPQIGKVIQEKFRLDRIEVDGIYFKDNLRNVRPSRLRRLKEQVGYKMLALLDLWTRLPKGARLTCFGDDAESDALIYSLFSEVSDRWIHGPQLVEFLDKQGVFHDEAVRIAWRARKIPRSRTVSRVFIHMHADQDPRYWRRFGTRVTATRGYFQTAFVCFADGKISANGLADVGEEILSTRITNPYDLASAVLDLLERRVIDNASVARAAPTLIERKILPAGFP